MNVFVAGATGDLGSRVVRQLAAAGHPVIGSTRSRPEIVERNGGRGVIVDALDAAAVMKAVTESKPDAIVQALTALPRRGPMRESDLRATNTLRTVGTTNLIAAVRATGVTHYVAESVVFGYGGSLTRVFTEDDEPRGRGSAAFKAVEEHERMIRDFGGVVLRFGGFYGPGAGSTDYMLTQLRKRRLPLINHGKGTLPWIHLEDAASAVVAALDRAKPGETYNIVDDGGYDLKATINALAHVAGAKKPRSVPSWLSRIVAPYATSIFTTTLRVSNDKAKRDLSWKPAYPTITEGAQTLVGSM